MKKILLLWVFLIGIGCQVYAQQATIRGTIVATDQTPLTGITVGLEGTSLGASTNEKGYFELRSVSPGNYNLVATGVGYTATKKNIEVKAGKVLTLSLQLNQETQTLQEVVITADPYRATDIAALTRMSVPVRDLPQSVQAVTRTLINEQQAYRVDEALRNVAGVNVSSANVGYNFRGFTTYATEFLVNGMRGTGYPEGVSPSLANIERVEVLRGPVAILYGENAPAGNLNLVTKQPKQAFSLRSSITAGSFGLFRPQADVTGSLNKQKTLYGVAGFGYESGGRFTKNFDNQNLLLFGSLRWDITPRTSWQVNGTYNRDRATSGSAVDLPFKENDLFAVPVDFSYFPSDAKFRLQSFQIQSQLKHSFSDTWTANLWLGVSQTDVDEKLYGINDYIGVTAEDTLELFTTLSPQITRDWVANAYVQGKLHTGSIQHAVVAGIDIRLSTSEYPQGIRTYPAKSISIHTPDDLPFIPDENSPIYNFTSHENTRTLSHGVYVLQDFITITNKLKVLAGVRYSIYSNSSRADSLSYDGETFEPSEENPLDAHTLIPRLGVVYQPVASLSLYADYNKGFLPQYSNTRDIGGPFPPEITNQVELGIKKDWMQGKWTSTLAVYQINKDNVLVTDPDNSLRRRVIGQVRSKGVEVTLTGNVLPNLNMLVNYAWNKTWVTKDEPENVGKVFANSPQHLGNAWLTYQFATTILKGLKIGAGYQYSSERFMSERMLTNTTITVLPGYGRADAMASYTWKQWSLALNINNLANIRYIQNNPVYDRSYFPGTPRQWMLTAAYTL